jgi:ribose-phosphate pyrophosphokinase
MTVVVGQDTSRFAQQLAAQLNMPFVGYTIHSFSDGELYVQLQKTDIAPQNVIAVHRIDRSSTLSLNDQNTAFRFLLNQLYTSYGCSITLVLPYLPYSRLPIHEGFAHPLVAYSQLCKALNVQHIITFDLHCPSLAQCLALPITSLAPTHAWATALADYDFNPEQWLVVSPDQGGEHRARELAAALGLSYAITHKKRFADGTVTQTFADNVVGKKILLIDDIIDTGKTAQSACQLLMDKGAAEIVALFTHAIFSLGPVQLPGCTRLYVTDSLQAGCHTQQQCSVVTLQNHLSDFIKNIG